MALVEKQSFYLILLLLAALFIGPVVVLTQDRAGVRTPPLRPMLPVDRVNDAPASTDARDSALRVRGSRSPLPDPRPANAGLPIIN